VLISHLDVSQFSRQGTPWWGSPQYTTSLFYFYRYLSLSSYLSLVYAGRHLAFSLLLHQVIAKYSSAPQLHSTRVDTARSNTPSDKGKRDKTPHTGIPATGTNQPPTSPPAYPRSINSAHTPTALPFLRHPFVTRFRGRCKRKNHYKRNGTRPPCNYHPSDLRSHLQEFRLPVPLLHPSTTHTPALMSRTPSPPPK